MMNINRRKLEQGWILISVFIRHVAIAGGHTIDDVKILKATLFHPQIYDRNLRPVYNQFEAVQVTIGFGISHILSFEMLNGRLESFSYLTLRWRDHFLKWDPADYGGVNNIDVEPGTIWKPNIKSMYGFDELASIIRLSNTGEINWTIWQIHLTYCDIEVFKYPFDIQSCELVFFSTSSTQEICLVPVRSHVGLYDFKKNAEWEIIQNASFIAKGSSNDTEVTSLFGKPGISSFQMINTLRLKRLPSFIIHHSILPELALSILKLAVFVLPAESGERVSYSIALILAFTVFLSSLSAELPHNSRQTSIYSVFLITENFFASLCVILSIVSTRLVSFPPVRVPKCLHCCCKLFRRSHDVYDSESLSRLDMDKTEEQSYIRMSDLFDGICFVSFLSISCITFTTVAVLWAQDD